MSPNFLPDRKILSETLLALHRGVERSRKGRGGGWEDQLEKSLEAQIEAESIIIDRKELICFLTAKSTDLFPGLLFLAPLELFNSIDPSFSGETAPWLLGNHLGLFLFLTSNNFLFDILC